MQSSLKSPPIHKLRAACPSAGVWGMQPGYNKPSRGGREGGRGDEPVLCVTVQYNKYLLISAYYLFIPRGEGEEEEEEEEVLLYDGWQVEGQMCISTSRASE